MRVQGSTKSGGKAVTQVRTDKQTRVKAKGDWQALPGMELLAAAGKSEEARGLVRSFVKIGGRRAADRNDALAPPGTFLNVVLEAFRETTDIPLELPAAVAMSLVSTRLVQARSVVDFAGSKITPALWNVVLASSGAGKTFAANTLMKMLGITDTFPDPASAAKMVESLVRHNRTLWVRDEFGQFLKAVETMPHMAEIKDYTLRLYDGQRIERNTKAQEIVIDDPALVILGLTVGESFKTCVPAEAMVDGFAQRFLYTVAPDDPARPPLSVPIYEPWRFEDAIRNAWAGLTATPIHPVYHVPEEALDAFKALFRSRLTDVEALPASFYRRVMFAAVRYAAVYHLMLGNQSPDLTPADFGWAGRMIGRHLDDARQVLDDYGLGDLERIVKRAEEVKEEIEASGHPITPRHLIRKINSIKTAEQARSILRLIEENGR